MFFFFCFFFEGENKATLQNGLLWLAHTTAEQHRDITLYLSCVMPTLCVHACAPETRYGKSPGVGKNPTTMTSKKERKGNEEACYVFFFLVQELLPSDAKLLNHWCLFGAAQSSGNVRHSQSSPSWHHLPSQKVSAEEKENTLSYWHVIRTKSFIWYCRIVVPRTS